MNTTSSLVFIVSGILAMLFKTIWRPKRVVNVGFFWLIRRYFSVSSIAAIDRAAKDGELRVFVVAGEVSGDTIGSRLMASLKKLSPFPIHFAGVGGLALFSRYYVRLSHIINMYVQLSMFIIQICQFLKLD